MKIVIETIPHAEQRYDTLGDWFLAPDGTLVIRVSSDQPEAASGHHQLLIGLHELIEAVLCIDRGITQEQVDAFDYAFKGEGEPGDAPGAPYGREHRFAMLIEHLMAHELGIRSYGKVE